MAFTMTATSGLEMPPLGMYVLTCMEVGEPQTSEMYPDQQQIRFIFEINEVIFSNDDDAEEFVGERVPGYANYVFGPKSKLRQWAQAMLNRQIQDGENISSEDLIGKQCIGEITLNQNDKPKLDNLKAYTKKRGAKAKKQRAGAPDGIEPEEFDEDESEDF